MAKYKLIYDRTNCIGAAACVAVYEKRWKLSSDDGKADLIGGNEKEGKWILEFTDDELDKFKESAQACPVDVIKIVDEEGKEVI